MTWPGIAGHGPSAHGKNEGVQIGNPGIADTAGGHLDAAVFVLLLGTGNPFRPVPEKDRVCGFSRAELDGEAGQGTRSLTSTNQ